MIRRPIVSNRTGTSKSKSALIWTFTPGVEVEVIKPVATFTHQPESCSIPVPVDPHSARHRPRDPADSDDAA